MPKTSTTHDQSHHGDGADGTHVMPYGTVMKGTHDDHLAHATTITVTMRARGDVDW